MEEFSTILLPAGNTPKAAVSWRGARLVQIQPLTLDLGSSFELRGDPVIVGRGPEALVRLDDPSVSRQHARIEADAEGHTIVDLQSTNQTFVNDRPVACQRLEDGDYLRIGNYVLRYLADSNVETEYHATVRRLTITDPLTLLLNRRAVMDLLNRELSRTARHVRPLSVGLFDVDDFKAINDRLGHAAGDLLLVQIAWRVQSAIRKEDVLARLGGDEFVILLPDTPLDRSQLVADRVRDVVREEPFQLDTHSCPVTISLGMAATPGGERISAEQLLQRADAEMYAIKRARGSKRARPPLGFVDAASDVLAV
ncbi:MAG TPA: GGDEF domain-containing protein, partial [Gemmataceae bacterium]|nr:GGDEF domain-containing protein [Gemmataceae bacterium]